MPLPRREATSSFSHGMSLGVAPRRSGRDLADHGAAVAVLPAWSGIVTADGLAIRQQRGDRFAERPAKLAVGAGLAFIDLCALGLHREHNSFSRHGDSVGKRCLGGRRAHQRPHSSRNARPVLESSMIVIQSYCHYEE
jgi:hypothetical protein